MSFRNIKTYIILLPLYCLPFFASAQHEVALSGMIYKKSSSERIAQVTVTDMRSLSTMVSDELGVFNIKVAMGDTLVFNKNGYTQLKVTISSLNDMFIYMQPIVHLDEVTIKAKSAQQEMNDVVNTYRSKGLYFDGKPPITAFLPFGGSPITGFYEMFSRDAANERRFIRFSKSEMEAIQVDKRYNKQLVKRVTALPDSDVVKFMQQYTPSYEDIKEWNDYELISHIKKYLEYYNKHKDGMPLQKLY